MFNDAKLDNYNVYFAASEGIALVLQGKILGRTTSHKLKELIAENYLGRYGVIIQLGTLLEA